MYYIQIGWYYYSLWQRKRRMEGWRNRYRSRRVGRWSRHIYKCIRLRPSFDSIWLRDKGAGRGLPHRYQPLWFWFWLWLLMLTGIEAWPFFPKSIGISFAFEEKRRFWRSAEAFNSDQVPLVLLEDGLGCIDYCLWYDFPVVGRALWVGSLFSVIGLYVKVVTVCIAFVITQLEIRVYAGSEYIEGEGDKNTICLFERRSSRLLFCRRC
mgnify:CR=1 FL=1